jgi:hypothetical protein
VKIKLTIPFKILAQVGRNTRLILSQPFEINLILFFMKVGIDLALICWCRKINFRNVSGGKSYGSQFR